jgi:deoxyribonuclease-4
MASLTPWQMKIGRHICKGKKGYVQSFRVAINDAKKCGIKLSAGQIFVVGPRDGTGTVEKEDEKDIKKFIDENKISLVVHGAYIDTPFSTKKNGAVSNTSIGNIKREIKIAKNIGAIGVNIHLSAVDHDRIIDILDKLGETLEKNDIILYLETNACLQNTWSFEKTENINKLFKLLDSRSYKQHVGICIDTAHLWACGLDISTSFQVKPWLKSLDRSVIPNIMFHLNDDRKPRGTGADNHESIGYGKIWGTSKSGLISFLDYITKHKLIMILERNEEAINNDYLIMDTYMTSRTKFEKSGPPS